MQLKHMSVSRKIYLKKHLDLMFKELRKFLKLLSNINFKTNVKSSIALQVKCLEETKVNSLMSKVGSPTNLFMVKVKLRLII